jgi:hypothetical protein
LGVEVRRLEEAGVRVGCAVILTFVHLTGLLVERDSLGKVALLFADLLTQRKTERERREPLQRNI